MSLNTMFSNEFYEEAAQVVAPSDRKLAISSVDKAIAHMIQNFGEDLTLDDLASASGITKFNLCRSFQRRFSITPMKWLWTFRTLLAAEFIRIAPAWSLTDIAFTCGFTSSAHFSRSFTSLFKCSPSAFRKNARLEKMADPKIQSSLEEFGMVYDDNTEVVRQAYERMIKHIAK